jgi:hypothetical protein
MPEQSYTTLLLKFRVVRIDISAVPSPESFLDAPSFT